MKTQREWLTTGIAAKLCRVSIKSVIKWIDLGLLPAFTMPASSHRRINKADLIAFMIEHGIPLDTLGEMNAEFLE